VSRPIHEVLPDFPDTRMGQELEDYARGARLRLPTEPLPVRAMFLLGSALQGETVGDVIADLDQLDALLDEWRDQLSRLDPTVELGDQVGQANRDERSADERQRIGRGTTRHRAFSSLRAVRS